MDLFSGNDVLLHVTAVDADSNNAALDLSGVQDIIWALSKKVNGSAIITKSLVGTPSLVTVTDAANGKIDITLSSDELEPLKGPYYHELRLTNADGKKVTLLFGAVTIQENLIRTA